MANYSLKYTDKKGNACEISSDEIFSMIWDDFLRGKISREYTRGLLRDLSFTSADVFHCLEMLGLAKAEYDRGGYNDPAFI